MNPTVYIPNLNGGKLLAKTLESLRPLDGTRVVVVDNGSEDDSVPMLRERFPEVELIALEQNIGFGRALNLAVERIPGDPVIFLNNDVECESGFVRELMAGLSADVDAVAGVLVQKASPELVDSAGVVVEADTLMAFDYLHGESVSQLDSAPPPLGPTGGAALFRHDVFRELGGFDERIFVYYEDVDLALRMRLRGARCALAPGARGIHGYSATLGARTGRKYEMTGWSRGYLLRRYGVIDSPGAAWGVLAREGVTCAGQLVRDRTLGGLRGRARGWRAARGLERRPVPLAAALPLSLRQALALRRRRHAG